MISEENHSNIDFVNTMTQSISQYSDLANVFVSARLNITRYRLMGVTSRDNAKTLGAENVQDGDVRRSTGAADGGRAVDQGNTHTDSFQHQHPPCPQLSNLKGALENPGTTTGVGLVWSEVMLLHSLAILICGPHPAGVPPHFAAWLDYTPTGTTWFIAAEEPGASDANDGLSPSYSRNNHGPWKSLSGPLIHDITLGAGDAVALRAGTYSVNTPDQELSIFSPGTKQNPIMVFAWQDEHVVIDGSFDLADFIEEWGDAYQDAFNAIYHQSRVFRLDAPFSIVRGLHFTGCPYTCVTWRATHAMMIDCSFESGVEDQIKFTEQPQSNTRIGVHHTRQNVDGVVTTMSPQRTTITQNTSLNTSTGELIMASHPGRGFAAHHNIWFQPGERWFRIKSRIVEGLSAWRSFGLGAGSVALPLNP
jgi:hypothetical protein